MDNVNGIPGSRVIKFFTREEAEAAFSAALDEGAVVRVVMEHERYRVQSGDSIPGMSCAYLPYITHRGHRINHFIVVNGDSDDIRVAVVFVGRNPGMFIDNLK